MEIKNCNTCSKPLKGRTDKKYCNDYCRNNYNNRLKAPVLNLVRNINNALGKNRRILERILEEEGEAVIVRREILLDKGFRFKYYTHCLKSRKGRDYYFCYDHGYFPVSENSCIIIRKEPEEYA